MTQHWAERYEENPLKRCRECGWPHPASEHAEWAAETAHVISIEEAALVEAAKEPSA